VLHRESLICGNSLGKYTVTGFSTRRSPLDQQFAMHTVALQIEDGKISDARITLKNVLCNINVKHRNVVPQGLDASHSDQIAALTSRKELRALRRRLLLRVRKAWTLAYYY
jgi:hypothetical protein